MSARQAAGGASVLPIGSFASLACILSAAGLASLLMGVGSRRPELRPS